MTIQKSDALVFFGATGDLAFKKIFPSLQAMLKRGNLKVPVICVAKGSSIDQLRTRVHDSLETHGGGSDRSVFDQFCNLLRYVDGDYKDPATFRAIRKELGPAVQPAHYLAIPPLLFGEVVEQLGKSGCANSARVIVEKPFGTDLASARELNRILLGAFPETSVFRIDHYLGKRPIRNMLYFRFANSLPETFWDRNHVESVQVTMAEDFGIQGRGGFYDATGAIRDVMQNHVFQVVSNLAMEPPVRVDSESIRDEKVKVLKAIPPLDAKSIVRGQFRGYKAEKGVARDSTTETFAAMRLEINSQRWHGVPFFLRAGKCLPLTCTEILVRLRQPPTRSLIPGLSSNYMRWRLGPELALGFGMMVKSLGDEMVGEPAEMLAVRSTHAEEMDAYERLLTDALDGDATLFARQDYVEEAWRIVDPLLKSRTPVFEYNPGTWGPLDVDKRVLPPGGWHNPATTPVREAAVEAA